MEKKGMRFWYWSGVVLFLLLLGLSFYNPFCGPPIPGELSETPYSNSVLGFSLLPPADWETIPKDAGTVVFLGHKDYEFQTDLEVFYSKAWEPADEKAMTSFVEDRRGDNQARYSSRNYRDMGVEYIEIEMQSNGKKPVIKKIPVLIFSISLRNNTYVRSQAFVFNGQEMLMLSLNVHKSEFGDLSKKLLESVVRSVSWSRRKK